MTPIQDLIHRIQWDPDFGNARFRIGYYDRVAGKVIRVPFKRIQLAQGARFSFDVEEANGTMRMVPFHRVREVWRNGQLIWERKPA